MLSKRWHNQRKIELLEIERKTAVSNYKLSNEQNEKLSQTVIEMRARLADAECKHTKLEIENKELRALEGENRCFYEQYTCGDEAACWRTDRGKGGTGNESERGARAFR